MRRLNLLLCSSSLVIGSFFVLPLHAQDGPKIYLYSSQVPLEAPRIGSSVTLFTQSEMLDKGYTTLSDVLRATPGIGVSNSGTRGSLTQIRIRGSESNHLKVLIDGIEANFIGDGAFDGADMPTTAIEQVEIIRGPQSGVFGANAHAGVIAITTVSGRGLKKPTATIEQSFGSRGFRETSATIAGSIERFYGSSSISLSRENGYSIARNSNEQDGTHQVTFNTRAGVDLTENVNVESVFRYNKRYNQTDPQDSAFPATPTYGYTIDGDGDGRNETVSGRIALTHKILGNSLVGRGHLAFTSEKTGYDENGAFSFASNGTRLDTGYKLTGKTHSDHLGGMHHTATAGFDFNQETYKYDSTSFAPANAAFWAKGVERNKTGIFAEYIADFVTQTTLGLSVRQDFNTAFKDALTYRATLSQRLLNNRLRVHGSFGKGITNPTFFEQYGFFASSFVGNPNLTPEHSIGYDLGAEMNWLDGKLFTDVTYFESRLKDEIFTVFGFPTSTVANAAGTSLRRGLENTLTYRPTQWLDLTGTYTYTLSEEATKLQEIRRPKHTGSFAATVKFYDNKAKASIILQSHGKTLDNQYLAAAPYSQRVNLKALTTVGAKLSYDLNKQTTAFVRAENVLNRRGEEVFSYRQPGFEIRAGLRATFGGK